MAKFEQIPYEGTYQASENVRIAGNYRKIIYDAELLGEYKGHTLVKLTSTVIDYHYGGLIRTDNEYVCKRTGEVLDTKYFKFYGTRSVDDLKRRIDDIAED